MSTESRTNLQRTDLAEQFVERFAQIPLTAECVFRSPKYLPAGKELCDHLLLLRNDGIIVSLKCQKDPTSRSRNKLQRWAAKAARNGKRQAGGAIQRLKESPIYCEHPRRGRVDIGANAIEVSHAIVAIETREPVALPHDLPLDLHGIPVTYLSTNDFLNMIGQLRAHPDIKRYLSARRYLPRNVLLAIGAESLLYQYYLLKGESFEGFLGIRTAVEILTAQREEVEVALSRKSEADRFGNLIEQVSDALAERHPQYCDGIDSEILARFDAPDKRANYLVLQENLCDLHLADRRYLGSQFEATIQKVRESADSESMFFTAVWTDSKPDFVYIVVSAKGVSRNELIHRVENLLLGALAHYKKSAGMFIVDRDGTSYEVGYFRDIPHTPEIQEFGRKHFGHLKISDHPSTLAPGMPS